MILLLLCAFLVSSCVIAVIDYSGSRDSIQGKRFHETLPFPEGGELSLDNAYGNIEIQGWDEEEMEISATRMLPRRFKRKILISDMEKYLPRIQLDKNRNKVLIRTEVNENREDQGPVDYLVNVPRFIHLGRIAQKVGDIWISSVYGSANIELDRGDIVVENFSGTLTAVTGKGEIEIHLYDVRDEDEIRVETGLGRIVVYLEDNVNILIEAEAQSGKVFTEFPSDRNRSMGKYFQKIGEGEARLILNSADGEIHIRRTRVSNN